MMKLLLSRKELKKAERFRYYNFILESVCENVMDQLFQKQDHQMS